MKDYRCPECGRLLFKSDAAAGTIQTVCPRCRWAVRSVKIESRTLPPKIDERR